MNYHTEQQVRDEARRLGFSMQRNNEGGFVLVDRCGDGIIRATPSTLKGVHAFLSREVKISSLRRRAKKLGYRFYKSTWRRDTIDNLGQYQVCEGNTVVEGDKYDADLERVACFIERKEAEAAR